MKGSIRVPHLLKTCERCDLDFKIPNLRESRVRELAFQFFPCPNCGFVKSVDLIVYNRSGRCRSCSIPFSIINHHAKGFCKRCYGKELSIKGKCRECATSFSDTPHYVNGRCKPCHKAKTP